MQKEITYAMEREAAWRKVLQGTDSGSYCESAGHDFKMTQPIVNAYQQLTAAQTAKEEAERELARKIELATEAGEQLATLESTVNKRIELLQAESQALRERLAAVEDAMRPKAELSDWTAMEVMSLLKPQ